MNHEQRTLSMKQFLPLAPWSIFSHFIAFKPITDGEIFLELWSYTYFNDIMTHFCAIGFGEKTIPQTNLIKISMSSAEARNVNKSFAWYGIRGLSIN